MTSVDSKVWGEASLRHADLTDVTAIERLVHSAYEKYVSRIGRKPKPMLANYEQAVTSHQTWVVTNGDSICAVLELIPSTGFMLIENVAVPPLLQKLGYGRGLMQFAEVEAKRQSFHELRLYTNETFTENIRFYASIGYAETHRESYLGSKVVHMSKLI